MRCISSSISSSFIAVSLFGAGLRFLRPAGNPVRQEAPRSAREGLTAMYLLEVLSGPLDGKTWPFEREITIGRDEALAEACLALDRYVSRQHARLQLEAGAMRLVDLRSRNGTRLGGKAVVGAVPLPVGVPFVVGRTILRVTRA